MSRNIETDGVLAEPAPGLSKSWVKAANWFAGAYAALFFYTAYAGPFPPLIQRPIFVGGAMVLVFLLYPVRKGRVAGRARYWNIALIVLTMVTIGYFIQLENRIDTRPGFAAGWDVPISVILTLLLMEAMRRTIGLAVGILMVLAILYGFFGNYIPGELHHRGFSLESLVGLVYITSDGAWGMLPRVLAGVAAIFILFGSFMIRCGLGEILLDIVQWMTGSLTAGAAKVSVIASGLFGTVSGSVVSNIVLTGSVTIPTMKRLGYKPELAAAVEAVASTGGQLMPPVMGAVVFVMAEFIGKPYREIALMAVLPALLYYWSCFLAVHLFGLKYGLKGSPRSELPKARDVLAWNKVFLVVLPLGVLIWFIFIIGYSITLSGFIACAAVIIPHLVEGAIRHRLKIHVVNFLNGFVDGGRSLVILGILVIPVMIIITLLTVTPFGVLLSNVLISVAGDNVLLGLIMAMVICLMLGMGLATTAAYVIAVSTSAPLLIALGVNLPTVHFFVLYYALLAVLTPPVMLAVFVAAPMAKASIWAVCRKALILAAGGFIIPYFIVYYPGITLADTPVNIILAFIKALLVISCLSIVLTGQFIISVKWIERAALLAAAGLIFLPQFSLNLAGLGVMVAVFALQRHRRSIVSTATELA